MLWGAIIVAAGRGTRFGRPKQLVELAGAPLVSWSIRTFARMPEIVDLVVVTEEPWLEAVAEIAGRVAGTKRYAVVAGGETRQQSVANGLRALPERCNAALVHDGARPLVRATDVRSGMRAVREGRAAVLGVPVVDTVKAVDAKTHLVTRTIDRSSLWAAQTPQLAATRDLRRAHAEAARDDIAGTDEMMLLERIGIEVEMIAGDPENFKVTVPADLMRAEYLMRDRLEHLPDEEEVLLVEVFVDGNLVDAVCSEIEARGGTIDAIDRELPSGAAVRAYVRESAFHGFGERFEAFSTGAGTFTTRFSHYGGRAEAV